jgi:hypothetical protein
MRRSFTVQQLQATLKDATPLGACIWPAIHPGATSETNHERRRQVHEALGRLWSEMQRGAVRNRGDLEKWFQEALEVEVSPTPSDPTQMLTFCDQEQHNALAKRYGSLDAHPWMERVKMMIQTRPAMVEVRPVTIPLSNSDQ